MGKYNTIELKMMFKQLLIICLIATVVVTNSRFPVNEKPGTIARYFINRHEQRCYESLLPSAIAMSFQVGTCKSQGFPVKKMAMGMPYYGPSRLRRAVFEREGDQPRYFIEKDVQRCRQSMYESATALGYVNGTCKAQGYPVLHANMGFTWWTKSRLRRAAEVQSFWKVKNGECRQYKTKPSDVPGYVAGTCSEQGYKMQVHSDTWAKQTFWKVKGSGECRQYKTKPSDVPGYVEGRCSDNGFTNKVSSDTWVKSRRH